jgi:hypothetical protein
VHAFFDADPSPRRAFTAYSRCVANTVVVVRWLWRCDSRWAYRNRLELEARDAVEALLDCERIQHDAAPALFGAVSGLPGLSPKLLDARISSALGEDHGRFSRPDVDGKVLFLRS